MDQALTSRVARRVDAQGFAKMVAGLAMLTQPQGLEASGDMRGGVLRILAELPVHQALQIAVFAQIEQCHREHLGGKGIGGIESQRPPGGDLGTLVLVETQKGKSLDGVSEGALGVQFQGLGGGSPGLADEPVLAWSGNLDECDRQHRMVVADVRGQGDGLAGGMHGMGAPGGIMHPAQRQLGKRVRIVGVDGQHLLKPLGRIRMAPLIHEQMRASKQRLRIVRRILAHGLTS